MDSGRKLELEETEGWIEIVSPEKEIILLEQELKKSKEQIIRAEELKKDVQAYLQETVNALQALDLAKLDTQKLEKELHDTRLKLELAQKDKDKIATIFTTHIGNHGDTMNDLQLMKDENTQLKNQQAIDTQKIKELKLALRKQKKLTVRFKKLKKSYRNVCKKLLIESEELAKALHSAQNNVELDALRQENADQKQTIERLSHSEAGFFSPRKIPVSVLEPKKEAKPF